MRLDPLFAKWLLCWNLESGGFRMRIQVIAGIALLGFLGIPQVTEWLESTMTGQMLIQIPLLVVAGYWLGRYLAVSFPGLHSWLGGIPGLLIVVFTMLFWMLPRSLDATLDSSTMESAKYLTLPLLAGVPLGVGWSRLGFIAKGLVWTHLISMVFIMSWLYTASPIRVCNRYLLDSQQTAGRILFGVGIAILVYHALNALARGLLKSVVKPIAKPEKSLLSG
jgi:hypothetical protein